MTTLFDDFENYEAPILPYNGTSGWSGSATSESRAKSEDANGTTSKRQQITHDHLNRAGMQGLTWKELAELTGWHHGQATAVLSVLHKEGVIARLTGRRNACEPYCLPKYIQGRDTAPHGRSKPKGGLEAEVVENYRRETLRAIDYWFEEHPNTFISYEDLVEILGA
jgi:hypothetical protein